MWKCNSKCEFIILHIYNVQTKKLRYPKYQKHRATEQRSGINGMMLLRDQTNFRDTYKLVRDPQYWMEEVALELNKRLTFNMITR